MSEIYQPVTDERGPLMLGGIVGFRHAQKPLVYVSKYEAFTSYHGSLTGVFDTI